MTVRQLIKQLEALGFKSYDLPVTVATGKKQIPAQVVNRNGDNTAAVIFLEK